MDLSSFWFGLFFDGFNQRIAQFFSFSFQVLNVDQVQIKFKHHETSGKMKISFYYLPIANQVAVEMKQGLEDEPPGPIFPLNAARQSEAIRSQMEFMSF